MSRAAPEFVPAAWPALMSTDLACAYTCLSEASFRFFAKRHGLSPVDCAGLSVTRWRKADLDGLIDRLPTRGAQIPLQANDAPDDAQAALERARRRRKG